MLHNITKIHLRHSKVQLRHKPFSNILMKEENVMKKTIKSALSKGVSAMLTRTLTSSANASSSYYLNQPVEPAALKKFKKTR